MPHWLSALILGLIEGLTEFIPVSSTGHLLIAEHWIGRRGDAFNAIIQCGAMLALLPVFWTKIVAMMQSWKRNDRHPEKIAAARDYALKLALAFFITGSVGFILDKRGFKMEESIVFVAWATLIGAFVIFGMEAWAKIRFPSLKVTWPVAVACGIAQLLAVIFPGTSRSGATIMLAMGCGLARPAATEFSFLLGLPTLMAAGGLKLVKELIKARQHGGLEDSWSDITIGFVASGVSAFFVVRWLIRYVQNHTFNGFAIYRLLLGIALLMWFKNGQ